MAEHKNETEIQSALEAVSLLDPLTQITVLTLAAGRAFTSAASNVSDVELFDVIEKDKSAIAHLHTTIVRRAAADLLDLKIWPKEFEKVNSGYKTLELRLNRKGLTPGATLRFREWNPETKEYTGKECYKLISECLSVKSTAERFYGDEEVRDGALVVLRLV